jgi:hypothetical protein
MAAGTLAREIAERSAQLAATTTAEPALAQAESLVGEAEDTSNGARGEPSVIVAEVAVEEVVVIENDQARDDDKVASEADA